MACAQSKNIPVHSHRAVGLDNNGGSWQGRTIGMMATSQGLPRWDLDVASGEVPSRFVHLSTCNIHLSAIVWMAERVRYDAELYPDKCVEYLRGYEGFM